MHYIISKFKRANYHVDLWTCALKNAQLCDGDENKDRKTENASGKGPRYITIGLKTVTDNG